MPGTPRVRLAEIVAALSLGIDLGFSQPMEHHWRRYLQLFFDRATHSPGYTFDDYRAITAPTLILTGDRDHFCSVEEAVAAYHNLADGELAIVPHTGHVITPVIVDSTIEFLLRHLNT